LADTLEKEGTMTDSDLTQDVRNGIGWEPSVAVRDIGVSVNEGVVTHRGSVNSYTEKFAAERVALRMYGVKAVANDLSVKDVKGYQRSDTEIARIAVAALMWYTAVPDAQLRARRSRCCCTVACYANRCGSSPWIDIRREIQRRLSGSGGGSKAWRPG
jgi:hypothetical protein